MASARTSRPTGTRSSREQPSSSARRAVPTPAALAGASSRRGARALCDSGRTLGRLRAALPSPREEMPGAALGRSGRPPRGPQPARRAASPPASSPAPSLAPRTRRCATRWRRSSRATRGAAGAAPRTPPARAPPSSSASRPRRVFFPSLAPPLRAPRCPSVHRAAGGAAHTFAPPSPAQTHTNPTANAPVRAPGHPQVTAMQRDSCTYCDEPEDAEDFDAWSRGFSLQARNPGKSLERSPSREPGGRRLCPGWCSRPPALTPLGAACPCPCPSVSARAAPRTSRTSCAATPS